ncbi:MAG: ATP-binding protein [Spirochaetes bacterium]|nr:ATP-binding protein [Spirochaetota bacterium]
MQNRTQLSTKILISGMLTLIILLLTSGFLGLYSIRKAMKDSQYFTEAELSALRIQGIFQNQFHLWENMILKGNDPEQFQNNYHKYSKLADRVQDSLFNLKLACMEINGIPDKIENLRIFHNSISREHHTYIAKLNEEYFKDKSRIVNLSQKKVKNAIREMDDIVNKIKTESNNEIQNINEYYFNLILFTLILLSAIGGICAVYVTKKILGMHTELEKKVKARTRELEELNDKLTAEIEERKKTEELLLKSKKEIEEANISISISEKKYRMLVDESNDIIFSLNEDLNIISSNRALNKHLKINPQNFSSMHFLDLINEDHNGRGVAKRLVKEKIESFLINRKPVEFIASFNSGLIAESKEMSVKLEFLNIEGKNEIHGIASPQLEDSMLKYFVFERQMFAIENYLLIAEEASQRMVRNLHRFITHDEVTMIRIALREILINAIEHGNLDISYAEKTQSLIEDNYFQLVANRRSEKKNSRKLVHIEYQISSRRAEFKITDQGNGFNHEKILSTNLNDLNTSGEQHGRGIAMTKEIFSSIKYNKKGNSVLLIKEFSAN